MSYRHVHSLTLFLPCFWNRYLELADWELKEALRSAKEDNEWEREMDDGNSLKSGEIRITMGEEGLKARGAGIFLGKEARNIESTAATTSVSAAPKKKEPTKPISKDAIPAIESKTVKAEDVVNAAPQQGNYGVELSTLSKK